MSASTYPQVKRLPTLDDLRARLDELGVELPIVDGCESLARPISVAGRRCGNRFVVLPMEGWDATVDGRPTELVRRRWRRFGQSGAKLVWGGEAVAVRHDGRANPHQLVLTERTVDELAALRGELVRAHADATGTADDLVVGLQLTHSGRFARPDGEPAPRTAYVHPLLDGRVGAGPASVLGDDDLDELVAVFVRAGELAAEAGFDFVDIKACHGYLGHELLTAHDRPGRYGGDLVNRLRFATSIVAALRSRRPELPVGVRLSVFDVRPFVAGVDGVGEPAGWGERPYPYALGGDSTGLGIDLGETHAVIDRLVEAGVQLLCVTGGSPYYNPHVQRPAYFPPSDGYRPPEDPLVGVARLLGAAREVAERHPDLPVVASGLSYLQDHLPAVAEGIVRHGWAPLVGLGRMMLSYPTLPADVLSGARLERRLVCRTFSDCTTAPRHGMVSGCYPLDEAYKSRPERVQLAAVKRAIRRGEP